MVGIRKKAKQQSSAALLGRSHAAEFMGRRKMERCNTWATTTGSTGPSEEILLAELSSWVLEEVGMPAAGSGRAGGGVVLCQHFDCTIHGSLQPPQRGGSGARQRW